MNDLEADLFGGFVGVLDAGLLPPQATLAVWGHPIHGGSVNAATVWKSDEPTWHSRNIIVT